MEHLDDTVSEHDLSIYAQKCVLMPPLLARKLRIDESTLQDIMYNHPKDRYEQIYQVLWRWKQSEPNATWRDLQQATDSGVKRVLEHLYSNGDSDDEGLGRCVQEESHGVQECHPPPTKIRRRGGSPVPSAPPFELVHPIKGAAMFSHNVINGGGRGICIQETEKDSGSSKKGEENESFHDNSQELTYDKDYCTVLNELGHETKWYDLGLALQLKPSQLDEIKESNHDKVSECRKEMIKVWLKNSTNSSYIPTWLSLCNALREKIVGNKALAKQIARKYQIPLS